MPTPTSAQSTARPQARRPAADGRDVRRIFVQTLRAMWQDNALGTSAEIAFFYSFAIPPLLVFLVMLAAILNDQANLGIVDSLRTLVNDHAPPDTQGLFNSLIDRSLDNVNSGVASFGVITSALIGLWSISNAIAALIRVSNRVYDLKDDRSFLERRLLSLGLALVVVLTMNPAIILFFFGEYIGRFLTDQYGLDRPFEIAWGILRWPLAVIFIAVQLAVLYYFLPNIKQSFRWASTGSLLATLLWLIGAGAFLLYLELSDPSTVYGAFGGLLMLLAFLFMTGFAFLFGAEANAILAREFDPEANADLQRNPGKSTDPNDLPRRAQRA